MSAEQLTAFWAAVEADASLQDKLRASIDGEIDTPLEVEAVLAIAKDNGYSITAVDLLKAEALVMKADAQMILELDDEELDKVAGGNIVISGRGDGLNPHPLQIRSIWHGGTTSCTPQGCTWRATA
jgi:predicted ribosomally synthesized peptide with nif11-like leader